MPKAAGAAKMGRRLKQEENARSKAERMLGITALVAARLARHLSAEKIRRSAAEDAARAKLAALSAAEQLAADLRRQNVTEQQEHAVEQDALRIQHAAAEQRASDMARQLIREQEAHTMEMDALRSKLVAADLQAADMAATAACQLSKECKARLAAQQAQAAAAAEAEHLQWDLGPMRLQVTELQDLNRAELAQRQVAEELLQATLQQALVVEQRVSLLETGLQQAQQQAACAVANAAAAEAKRMAYLSPLILPEVCTHHTMSLILMHACHKTL